MDSLRKERKLSIDDNNVGYSPGGTDWRSKYNEVLDMLADTKAELDEFHAASKELEAELEAELARTEQSQQDLKIKVAKAEMERDDWKSKFMSLQTNHNTTTTSLQRELDKLRQEHQAVKVQLRDLEMGNDDLERNERAISSSLQDMEAKYSKVLEEKILQEHELLQKVHLEEEMQRVKDELRDANEENAVVKNRLAAAEEAAAEAARQVIKLQHQRAPPVVKPDLFGPTPDLQLAELSPTQRTPRAQVTTPKTANLTRSVTHGALQRASLYAKESPLNALRPASLARSIYSPTASTSRLPTRGTPVQPSISGSSTSTAATTSTTVSKKKGALQMAANLTSEMGARLRNFDQRLGTTKMARIRMGSITGRTSTSSNTSTATSTREDASSVASSSTAKTSVDSHRYSIGSRASIDSLDKTVTRKGKDAGGDSGWVLIMEDSPSPQKVKKDARRMSNPLAPTSFRANRAKSPSLTTGPQMSLNKSTSGRIPRPQSRLSGAGLSAGPSSVSPVSRPTTPTFLPIPTGGFSSSAALKRSTGPNSYNPGKRASFGATTPNPSPPRRQRPVTQPPLPRPIFDSDDKALPQLPNVTMRTKSTSGGALSAVLSKSRIGRPPSGTNQRRTTSDGMQDMKARIYSSPQRPGK